MKAKHTSVVVCLGLLSLLLSTACEKKTAAIPAEGKKFTFVKVSPDFVKQQLAKRDQGGNQAQAAKDKASTKDVSSAAK